MISTRHLISKFSSHCINLLVIVLKSLVTIGITVTFMFHSCCFFSIPSQGPGTYLSFRFFFFQFYYAVSQLSKVYNFESSLFWLIIIRSGRLAKIRWSVCISKHRKSLCILFLRTESGLCIYHLFRSSNFNFLHNSHFASLARAVEYTDGTSAERLDLPKECPGYETKQADGEVPVMLELWGIRSTPSLPLLPGPIWPGVVAPDRALSMG